MKVRFGTPADKLPVNEGKNHITHANAYILM